MEQPSRRWILWALLVVCAIGRPASAQSPVKKQLFQSNITIALSGIPDIQTGSAMLIVSPSSYEYLVRAHYYGPEVTRVTLVIAGDESGRHIVLCDNNGALNCTYHYNLDCAGTIVPMMLQYAENGAITVQEFKNALTSGTLAIRFDNGMRGEGSLLRIF
jgi:hypothetical protein